MFVDDSRGENTGFIIQLALGCEVSNMGSGNKIRSFGRVPNSPCWIVFISSIQIRTHGKREHRLRNFLSQIGAFFSYC